MITRSQDHQTITLRGAQLAIDIVTRPPEHKRAGLQVILDDDPSGQHCQTRLHVYGVAGWRELVALIKAAESEIETLMEAAHDAS